MTRLRLLDLFCGAGGCSVGYHRAGFDVVGVDIAPQPDYPFRFHQADALEVLTDPHSFACHADVIHASPPCQASSALTKGTNNGRTYPQLIPAVRELLDGYGPPYVIENVAGAPIRHDLMLCGEMFSLDVIRHRYFECSGWTPLQPTHVRHRGRVSGMRHGEWFAGPYWAVYGEGGGKGSVPQWQAAMGIDWTEDRRSIAEAIPPAYAEFVGRQLISQIRRPAA
jgi:site-specific DNA-cytosine methylase